MSAVKILIYFMIGLLEAAYAHGQVCQSSVSVLDDIESRLATSEKTIQCYDFELSAQCIKISDPVLHRTLMLDHKTLAISQDKTWQFQNRAQLGFYAPWVRAVETALRGKLIQGKGCSDHKGVRHCRIRLDQLQSVTFYQKDLNWISDYTNGQDRQIYRWAVSGDPHNPQLICPQSLGEAP